MKNVKSQVLTTLEKHRGEFFSGEMLAKKIGATRSAVNKAIKQLRNEGYKVDAVSNKGYSLVDCDLLSTEGIRYYLSDDNKNLNINFFKEIDSTNNEAKREIYSAIKPSVFVSEKQTAGRGRLGRSFYSPSNESIYLSLLVKPNSNIGLKITSYVAVAVSNAIESLTNQNVGIKWVNDIYINNKKVVGILCEGVTSLENNELEAVVIGVGLNCRVKNFPPEIKDIAGNILENSTVTRNELCAKVIDNILDVLSRFDDATIMDVYRQKSIIMGKDIRYIKDNDEHFATVKTINDNGALVVENDGIETIIDTGEVTIRKV